MAEAQTKASEAMNKVMTALTDSGVAEKDIQTQYFNIRQRTKWDRETDEETVVGYQVTNMVVAKIRDIDKVGVKKVEFLDKFYDHYPCRRPWVSFGKPVGLGQLGSLIYFPRTRYGGEGGLNKAHLKLRMRWNRGKEV